MSLTRQAPAFALPITLHIDEAAKGIYANVLKERLQSCFNAHFSYLRTLNEGNINELSARFEAALPFFSHSEIGEIPCTICFNLISKYRVHAFKFFVEMIRNWLLPGQKTNVPILFCADFNIRELGTDNYIFCEIMVDITNAQQLLEIQRNLPIIGTEIRLGVHSDYYARRILEVKGISEDQKTAIVQEYLDLLIHRLPQYFESDAITEMQHLMVICRDAFKIVRSSRHLCRIYSMAYIFRRWLTEAVAEAEDRRHIFVKMMHARLTLRTAKKQVLGLLIGMNYLSNKEFFEEKHILKAVQSYVPNAQLVEGSFFSHRLAGDPIAIHYLELEKGDGSGFTIDEVRRLKETLPHDLKDRIEHLVHPVFMPRNEEEIMRNILSLSDQIKFTRDIPQVIISFDEQTTHHLFFTIIWVHVANPDMENLQDLFHEKETFLEYIHDFTKNVGHIRKKHAKEAIVFRLKLPKDMFLRDDHAIDLYKARQVVVSELERVLGKFRDFNGGMISKQHELLGKVRDLLAEDGVVNDYLLENFFYSLTPVSMRSVLEAESLKNLFVFMLERLEKGLVQGEKIAFEARRDLDAVYVIVLAETDSVKESISRMLSELNISQREMGSTCVFVADVCCMGYIYFCDDPYKQDHFCSTIENSLRL